MIFKKGTEVEVLQKGREGFQFWRPGKILSGNGHTYMVKHDSCGLDTAVSIDKVPRKVLRPRPPVLIKKWACDDLVEVFDDGSWKLAEVWRTLGSNVIVARLLESSKEIVAPLFQPRIPHSWMDNRWIPLQKDFLKCKDLDVSKLSKRLNLSSEIPRVGRITEEFDDYTNKFYQKLPGRRKKRARTGAFGKNQKISKKGRHFTSTMHTLINQPFEKVYAVDSPPGENHMHATFCHETTGFGQKPIVNGGSNFVARLDMSENESTSSVGSCSMFDGLWQSAHHKASQKQDQCDHEDDAESICGCPTESSYFREAEMLEAVHSLELYAYRSTLKMFYASGSLSWDQETLLTNLRLALHISNDEHRSELKDLMSHVSYPS